MCITHTYLQANVSKIGKISAKPLIQLKNYFWLHGSSRNALVVTLFFFSAILHFCNIYLFISFLDVKVSSAVKLPDQLNQLVSLTNQLMFFCNLIRSADMIKSVYLITRQKLSNCRPEYIHNYVLITT